MPLHGSQETDEYTADNTRYTILNDESECWSTQQPTHSHRRSNVGEKCMGSINTIIIDVNMKMGVSFFERKIKKILSKQQNNNLILFISISSCSSTVLLCCKEKTNSNTMNTFHSIL